MAKDLDRASFEGLRKEAKRWLKAIRGGDGAALERLGRVLPKHAAAPGLREVQQALAREHGFESWAALKEHFEIGAFASSSASERIDEFLQRACIYSSEARDFPENWRRAERIRVRYPEIATATLHTAVVCGEVEHVAALLKRDPKLIGRKGGPQQWEPLLFVCYSRLPYPRAEQRSLEMARLLLDRGASPNDSQGLYNTHLARDDTRWLDLLFEYGLSKDDRVAWDAVPPRPDEPEPELMLSYLVAQAVHHGHEKRLACLLEHGADPNAVSRYTGRTCYREAVVLGRREIVELLLRHGAKQTPIENRDAFVAACNAGAADEARKLLEGHPEYLDDVEVLLDAAARGNVETVRLVLELGMDPNRAGKHGHRALNQGARRREVCELLWQHGADPGARCFGGTPAGWALHDGDLEMARLHAEHSRSLLDAVETAHVELARELLRERPECVRERTPWGDGPLHRLPSDAERALELIEMLLAAGADPDATNDAGKTPAQRLDGDGLDQIADLLQAAVDRDLTADT